MKSTGPMVDASLPFIHQVRLLVQPAELQGLAKDLTVTIPALAQLTVKTIPFMRDQVRPASSCDANIIYPWSQLTVPDSHFNASNGFPNRKVYIEAVDYLPGLAGESRNFDSNGPYIRVGMSAGAALTYTLANGYSGKSPSRCSASSPRWPPPRAASARPWPAATRPTPRVRPRRRSLTSPPRAQTLPSRSSPPPSPAACPVPPPPAVQEERGGQPQCLVCDAGVVEVKRAIKTHIGDFAAIIGLLVLSVVIAGYILNHERLRFPFIQSSPFTINADFSTAQAVTPGQGQTVRVSGVQVGEIGASRSRTAWRWSRCRSIEKYKHLIHTDATALLRPRTGLKDMFVELDPGSPKAPTVKPGYTIPVSNTMPDVNADEILASLDADTREYLDLLVNGAGQGLKNNGGTQLAQVLERFEPTHRDLARLNGAVAQRGQTFSS